MLALNGIFVLVTQHGVPMIALFNFAAAARPHALFDMGCSLPPPGPPTDALDPSGPGLEYPAFYTRLYNLITAEAFAAKHRAQFFKLADLFLSSGLVPAYTAAAFAKKMARLAVAAPPAGAMTAIAFIHNLIRRHPACTVLLDNPAGGSKAGPGVDVYDETQEDPAKSRAVESSLWELSCLRNHYCPQVGTSPLHERSNLTRLPHQRLETPVPLSKGGAALRAWYNAPASAAHRPIPIAHAPPMQVAALCAVLDKDLSDRRSTTEVDVDPLLSASYTSLFTQEAERRLKQASQATVKLSRL